MALESSHVSMLKEVLEGLKAIQKENAQLSSAVDAINGRVNMLAGVKQLHDDASVGSSSNAAALQQKAQRKPDEDASAKTVAAVSSQYDHPPASPAHVDAPASRQLPPAKVSKIILTSYPGQARVDPLPMDWGHNDPNLRGPVVVSRHSSTIRRRNGKSRSLETNGERVDRHANQTQPSALTEAHTPSITRWRWRARTSTWTTSRTLPTQSLRPTLAHSHSGATRRKSWPWTRWAISPPGSSRTRSTSTT